MPGALAEGGRPFGAPIIAAGCSPFVRREGADVQASQRREISGLGKKVKRCRRWGKKRTGRRSRVSNPGMASANGTEDHLSVLRPRNAESWHVFKPWRKAEGPP